MALADVNYKTRRNAAVEWVGLRVRARPTLARRVALGAAWLLAWAWLDVAWVVATAVVSGAVWLRRDVHPEVHEEVQDDTPEDWLRDVCSRAQVPMPLVLEDWPTTDGHAFRLLITEWCEREGRPMTVASWLAFAPLLRDVAGIGCRFVAPMPDPDHGGRATIEFQGVRLAPWAPPVPCDNPRCQEAAAVHLWVQANDGPWREIVASCVACTKRITQWTVIERHRHGPGCAKRTCSDWTTDDGPALEVADDYEPDRKCTPDPEPLSPLVILRPGPREGSEPLPPPDPATRRPVGATTGTRAGALWDHLAAAGRPERRGVLAERSGLSPTTVDKLLTAWADLGLCVRAGGLWRIASEYVTSGTLGADAAEEADRG